MVSGGPNSGELIKPLLFVLEVLPLLPFSIYLLLEVLLFLLIHHYSNVLREERGVHGVNNLLVFLFHNLLLGV